MTNHPRNPSFPKGEYSTEPDEETSSSQIGAKDGTISSWYKELIWELIGYWMMEWKNVEKI